MPKIQLLSFPGCPNAAPARAALTEAIGAGGHADAAGHADEIDEIDLAAPDAPAWARRWGSPTILIDGVDVEGAPAPDGVATSCRLYRGGVPSVAAIRARLTARS